MARGGERREEATPAREDPEDGGGDGG